MSNSRNSPSLFRRLLREDRGVTAVEFAFLAPLYFGILFFTCQIGLYLYYSASLSYATNSAARQVMTGAVSQIPKLTADIFRTQVLCPALPGMMSCDNIVINVVNVPAGGSFYGLQPPVMDNTKTSFCIGQPGSYIILQVFYAMPVLGISSMLSGAVTYNNVQSTFINSNAVFLNEPYTSSYNGC